MPKELMSGIIGTLIATLVSSIVSVLISYFARKKSDKSSLDAQLDSLLKLSIEYPYLESATFTDTWKDNCENPDDKYRRYENYATLVFNYLSRVCEFFGYKEKKINKYLDVKGWVTIHKDYWHHPTVKDENENVYDEKFKNIIHSILGEVLR